MNRNLVAWAALTCGCVSLWTTVGMVHPSARAQAPVGAQAAPQGPQGPPPGGGRGAPGTESGFATFQTRCSGCHGNPNVERAPTPAALREMSPEKIFDALTSGTMQAQSQGLTDDQKRIVA